MQTFRLIDRSDTEVTFEYQTLLGYWMYVSIVGYIAALAYPAPAYVEWVAFGSVLIYFITVFLPSRSTSKMLQTAMRESSLKMRGSRWSFSRPLTITVPAEFVAGPGGPDAAPK